MGLASSFRVGLGVGWFWVVGAGLKLRAGLGFDRFLLMILRWLKAGSGWVRVGLGWVSDWNRVGVGLGLAQGKGRA